MQVFKYTLQKSFSGNFSIQYEAMQIGRVVDGVKFMSYTRFHS